MSQRQQRQQRQQRGYREPSNGFLGCSPLMWAIIIFLAVAFGPGLLDFGGWVLFDSSPGIPGLQALDALSFDSSGFFDTIQQLYDPEFWAR